MRIENQSYIGVIDMLRVPNRHNSQRFPYVITRKMPASTLMVAGTAATQEEASELVQGYLRRFEERDIKQS